MYSEHFCRKALGIRALAHAIKPMQVRLQLFGVLRYIQFME